MNYNTDIDTLIQRILYHLKYTRGKSINQATNNDIFNALSLSVREIVQDRMFETENLFNKSNAKKVYYLSIEYLVGDSLENNLINLGIYRLSGEALSTLGFDLEEVISDEKEAALGTGGLGRLAACFLDSLSTLEMPGYGYGINYEFGSLKQKIVNGYQVEKPDEWCRDNSPWLLEKYGEEIKVPIFGHIEKIKDQDQCQRSIWRDCRYVLGKPYDMPVVGYGGKIINYIRLYSAKSPSEINFEKFYYGDYATAVREKNFCERISKIIYPSVSTEEGKELRLLQEYFLVACAIRDIVRNFERSKNSFNNFSSKVAIQINDTHPSLAIVELMRILIEEIGISWEKSWDITTATFGYTNHTLLPEALEKWPVYIMERLLPRHLDIIYKINKHFLNKIELIYDGDKDLLTRMSIIEESETRYVRMTNLSIIGSHSVNGVSALHSEMVKKVLVPDFHQLWPEKFNNKTNGITQRRWLLKANPELSKLITNKIGNSWITNLIKLRDLQNYSDNEEFQHEFCSVKNSNKYKLAKFIFDRTGVNINPNTLFDVHIKRIHEYKRQLLNVMHIIHTYFSIIEDGREIGVPRTFIFAGKSAPGYYTAKQIIKLINSVAKIINNDERVKNFLKVVFVPNYNVKVAEIIIPSTDLSEQISTAGKEASGTGNMKFALNGAVIIGTLDGANIEIKEEVGDENIFIFGNTPDQIRKMKKEQSYNPKDYYNNNDNIKRVLDSLASNLFCPEEPGIFKSLYDSLLYHGDIYYHLADFESYLEAQERVSREFVNSNKWAKKMISNVSKIAKFSSDRTVKEYAREIWDISSINKENI